MMQLYWYMINASLKNAHAEDSNYISIAMWKCHELSGVIWHWCLMHAFAASCVFSHLQGKQAQYGQAWLSLGKSFPLHPQVAPRLKKSHRFCTIPMQPIQRILGTLDHCDTVTNGKDSEKQRTKLIQIIWFLMVPSSVWQLTIVDPCSMPQSKFRHHSHAKAGPLCRLSVTPLGASRKDSWCWQVGQWLEPLTNIVYFNINHWPLSINGWIHNIQY